MHSFRPFAGLLFPCCKKAACCEEEIVRQAEMFYLLQCQRNLLQT